MRNIPKFFLMFCLAILFSYSCEDEKEAPVVCGVENPQENIEWLHNYLQHRTCVEVYLVVYQGQDYIGLVGCGSSPHPSSSYYKCNGEYFCGYDSYDGTWSCNEDFTEATNDKKLIYKHIND